MGAAFPFSWRGRLAQDGALLGRLMRIAVETVLVFYAARAGEERVGSVRRARAAGGRRCTVGSRGPKAGLAARGRPRQRGLTGDVMVEVPAVGAAGGNPLPGFLQDIFGPTP